MTIMRRDVSIILAAAGKSTRFRDPYVKKVFTLCSGKPVWQYSAQLFSDHPRVAQIIMAISPEDKEMVQEKFAGTLTMLGVELVLGGRERYESIRNALERVKESIRLVAVHDAARPCLTRSAFDAVLSTADEKGAAVLASPIRATVKRCDSTGKIVETVARDGLWQAQTPQVFHTELLQKAYTRVQGTPTDDAQVIEAMGLPVYCVEGPESNIKITTKEDLRVAEGFLRVPQRSKDNPFF
jgi:2-C-methyl-D-erythritol 4-phosphate cytidylyltransferase